MNDILNKALTLRNIIIIINNIINVIPWVSYLTHEL